MAVTFNLGGNEWFAGFFVLIGIWVVYDAIRNGMGETLAVVHLPIDE